MNRGFQWFVSFLAVAVLAGIVVMFVRTFQNEQAQLREIKNLQQQSRQRQEEVRNLGVEADKMARTQTEEMNTARALYQETFDKLTATDAAQKTLQKSFDELQKQKLGTDTSLQGVESDLKGIKSKLAETEKNLTTEKAARARAEKSLEESSKREEQVKREFADLKDQLDKANVKIGELSDALTKALTPPPPEPPSKTPPKTQ